ncbi:hypothetical protein C8R45DRAFT_1017494 [Mycena sanguinolenta]|nr:hypothetical protein C8R45DRAFT_1017494 [Mycena sanguinolenta]
MAAVAYHQHQQEAAAHFYHHQQQQQAQELEERRIEEERYHLQQLHQQQQALAYLAPYAHPHPHHAMAAGMDGMGLGLEMGMMEGYPQAHQAANMDAYHAHHHIEAQGDSQELAYPDSISAAAAYHTHAVAAAAAASPVSPYSLGYPPTPQLAYSYGAETMGFGMLGRPEAAPGKYDPSGLDADLGLLDMNMNMSISMGIGLGVGGAVG